MVNPLRGIGGGKEKKGRLLSRGLLGYSEGDNKPGCKVVRERRKQSRREDKKEINCSREIYVSRLIRNVEGGKRGESKLLQKDKLFGGGGVRGKAGYKPLKRCEPKKKRKEEFLSSPTFSLLSFIPFFQ